MTLVIVWPNSEGSRMEKTIKNVTQCTAIKDDLVYTFLDNDGKPVEESRTISELDTFCLSKT